MKVCELSYDEKLSLFNQVLKLKHLGLSGYDIGKRIGMNTTTARYWCEGRNNPFGNWNKADLNPSPDLSYVMGAFLGDGCSAKWRKRYHRWIILAVTDQGFVDEFNRKICKVLGKSKLYKVHIRNNLGRNHRKPLYEIRAGSIRLFGFLNDRNLEKFDIPIREYPADFIRGFFDAEGSAYQYSRSSGYGKCYPQARIQFSNTNFELLKLVENLLKEFFGINSKISEMKYGKGHWGSRRVWRLSIWSKDSVLKFINEIGSSNSKKAETFKTLLRLVS